MGNTYTSLATPKGGATFVPRMSAPVNCAKGVHSPRGRSNMPWYAMLRADREVTRKSSVSEASKIPYFNVGPTKQLVCPYLDVSGCTEHVG